MGKIQCSKLIVKGPRSWGFYPSSIITCFASSRIESRLTKKYQSRLLSYKDKLKRSKLHMERLSNQLLNIFSRRFLKIKNERRNQHFYHLARQFPFMKIPINQSTRSMDILSRITQINFISDCAKSLGLPYRAIIKNQRNDSLPLS